MLFDPPLYGGPDGGPVDPDRTRELDDVGEAGRARLGEPIVDGVLDGRKWELQHSAQLLLPLPGAIEPFVGVLKVSDRPPNGERQLVPVAKEQEAQSLERLRGLRHSRAPQLVPFTPAHLVSRPGDEIVGVEAQYCTSYSGRDDVSDPARRTARDEVLLCCPLVAVDVEKGVHDALRAPLRSLADLAGEVATEDRRIAPTVSEILAVFCGG